MIIIESHWLSMKVKTGSYLEPSFLESLQSEQEDESILHSFF